MQIDKDNLFVTLIRQAEFQIGGITILAFSHFLKTTTIVFKKSGI